MITERAGRKGERVLTSHDRVKYKKEARRDVYHEPLNIWERYEPLDP